MKDYKSVTEEEILKMDLDDLIDLIPKYSEIELEEYLKKIPVSKRDYNFYYKSLEKNSKILKKIPKEMLDEKIIKEYISKSSSMSDHLDEIPKNFQTDEIINMSLKRNSYNYKYISKDKMTKEMVKKLTLHIDILEDIQKGIYDEEILDEKICNEFMKSTFNLSALKNVPKKYQTEKVCRTALKKSGFNLEHIPQNLLEDGKIRNELYILALTDRGDMIEHIPKEFQTKEICMISAKGFGTNNTKYMNDKFLTDELYIESIKSNLYSIMSIPQERINEEMVMLITGNHALIDLIPKNLLSIEIILNYFYKSKEEKYENLSERLNDYLGDDYKRLLKENDLSKKMNIFNLPTLNDKFFKKELIKIKDKKLKEEKIKKLKEEKDKKLKKLKKEMKKEFKSKSINDNSESPIFF